MTIRLVHVCDRCETNEATINIVDGGHVIGRRCKPCMVKTEETIDELREMLKAGTPIHVAMQWIGRK